MIVPVIVFPDFQFSCWTSLGTANLSNWSLKLTSCHSKFRSWIIIGYFKNFWLFQKIKGWDYNRAWDYTQLTMEALSLRWNIIPCVIGVKTSISWEWEIRMSEGAQPSLIATLVIFMVDNSSVPKKKKKESDFKHFSRYDFDPKLTYNVYMQNDVV